MLLLLLLLLLLPTIPLHAPCSPPAIPLQAPHMLPLTVEVTCSNDILNAEVNHHSRVMAILTGVWFLTFAAAMELESDTQGHHLITCLLM